MEMGVPQFRHFPRRYSQVTSGTFRYQGMEYLQCGQWEGGETMLSPSGRRWMQTLRKLPIMEPNTKNTTDQKWNGTVAQLRESKVAESMPSYSAVNILFQRPAHDFHRVGLAGPQFQGLGALIEQHAETIGGAAACGFGVFEQGSLGGAVNHVIYRAGLPQRELLAVQRRRIVPLQAERGGVQEQIDWSSRVAGCHLYGWVALADFL